MTITEATTKLCAGGYRILRAILPSQTQRGSVRELHHVGRGALYVRVDGAVEPRHLTVEDVLSTDWQEV